MGGICLPIYPSQEVHVHVLYCTQRSVESEHLFWRGSFFFAFSWIAWGNLQQQKKEKCFGSFYIFCFWRGRFWYCCCCWALFLSRSGEFGKGKMEERKEKEKRERQYKVYFPTIFFRPRREKREGHLEKWEEKVFCIYIFICLYIFMSYIYYLVVFSRCVDRERKRKRRTGEGKRKQKNKKKTYIR